MLRTFPLDQRGHLFSSKPETDVLCVDGRYRPLDLHYSCGLCGGHPEITIQDGTALATSTCPDGEGITTTVTVSFPSGKVIVTDDLRPVYDGFDEDNFVTYNSARGQAQVIEAYAALGCAYGPVGNSCPGFYQTSKDRYVIANKMPRSKLIASVITDLWAYSIADLEDWKSRGGDPGTMAWADTVVDITPGTYRFTHHTGERSFDRDAVGPVIFAHVERVA